MGNLGSDKSNCSSGASRADRYLLCLLGLSLLGNVTLGIKVARAPRLRSSTAEQLAAPVGALVPPLDMKRYGAERVVVSLGSDPRPTLLYVFAPSCQWCQRNAASAHHLLSHVQRSYRVIALSLSEDVGEFVKSLPTGVPVYVNPTTAVYEAYRFGSTPSTLVISSEGRILKSWVGAYGGAVKSQIESFFNVSLPDLEPIGGRNGK